MIRFFMPYALALLLIAPAFAADVDPEVVRLTNEIAALDDDPSLADLAGVERLKARQAVAALGTAKSREREHYHYVAERRVQLARVAAEAALLRQQSEQLDREHDRILLAASRAEAARARREAERLRQQGLVQAEDAQRIQLIADQASAAREAATAEAAQARKLAAARAREADLARQEAELAAAVVADSLAENAPMPPVTRDARGEVITLAGNAFGSGSASLTAEARASLRRVAEYLGGKAGPVRIEGYTDSQGDAGANRRLSQQRAEVVKRVLVEAGIDAARLSVQGHGAADPVADNATAEGRARNRRVEIVVAGG